MAKHQGRGMGDCVGKSSCASGFNPSINSCCGGQRTNFGAGYTRESLLTGLTSNGAKTCIFNPDGVYGIHRHNTEPEFHFGFVVTENYTGNLLAGTRSVERPHLRRSGTGVCAESRGGCPQQVRFRIGLDLRPGVEPAAERSGTIDPARLMRSQSEALRRPA
jgi:hypothetical protein